MLFRSNITVQQNTSTVQKNENIIAIDGGNLIGNDCVEIIKKEKIMQGNNVSLSGIHKLSESVAFLCVGFTGAEMKLLMKRTILICIEENEHDEENGSNEDMENNENIEENKENLKLKEMKENTITISVKEVEKEGDKEVENSSFILCFHHFQEALSSVRPSVTAADLREYESWSKEKR